MIIPVKTLQGSYNIILERGIINRIEKYISVSRKVLIVTDDGVPEQYGKTVASFCKEPVIYTLQQGEKSKNIDNFKILLETLVKNSFTRSDCIVAVGGGVVGDLAGFVAASFMRGIDFYNIPTTLLSQVDSSVGGKTAIDFMGIKNIVGAFYQPKCVIIDPDTLKTLPKRQISNGIAESIKMAATSDKELFEFLEKCNIDEPNSLDFIISRSLIIKKKTVEKDEKESGLRRVLNFGHTLAHAIESCGSFDNLYHGESVALGMIPMCSDKVRQRLLNVLERFSLPTKISASADALAEFAKHDKKMSGDTIALIKVSEIGTYEEIRVKFDEYEKIIRGINQ